MRTYTVVVSRNENDIPLISRKRFSQLVGQSREAYALRSGVDLEDEDVAETRKTLATDNLAYRSRGTATHSQGSNRFLAE